MGFDTVEVRSSSLLVPTIYLIHLQPTAFSAWPAMASPRRTHNREASLRLLFRSSGSGRLRLGVILHLQTAGFQAHLLTRLTQAMLARFVPIPIRHLVVPL